MTKTSHGGGRRRKVAAWAAAICATLLFPSLLDATWSVIAIDLASGRVVIASATCVAQGRFAGFPADGLKDIQAIVVPGKGVAAAQAGVDRTRANQELIYRELKKGTVPEEILRLLSEDPDFERRQFAIADRMGHCVTHSGEENGQASLATHGTVDGILFSIQGNILASAEVVHEAAEAFRASGGAMTDRVMAAMEAADRNGGDRRCTCETAPFPEGAPCDEKTSHVAYILAADPDDPEGDSYGDGEYSLFIDVTDENIKPTESANPVRTLRMRYDAWNDARRLNDS